MTPLLVGGVPVSTNNSYSGTRRLPSLIDINTRLDFEVMRRTSELVVNRAPTNYSHNGTRRWPSLTDINNRLDFEVSRRTTDLVVSTLEMAPPFYIELSSTLRTVGEVSGFVLSGLGALNLVNMLIEWKIDTRETWLDTASQALFTAYRVLSVVNFWDKLKGVVNGIGSIPVVGALVNGVFLGGFAACLVGRVREIRANNRKKEKIQKTIRVCEGALRNSHSLYSASSSDALERLEKAKGQLRVIELKQQKNYLQLVHEVNNVALSILGIIGFVVGGTALAASGALLVSLGALTVAYGLYKCLIIRKINAQIKEHQEHMGIETSIHESERDGEFLHVEVVHEAVNRS